MTGIDLTEAAEAARAGVADRLSWASLHWGVEDVSADAWPHVATAAVAAAAPLIEAAVREKVAAEIEVLMRRHDGAQVGFSAVGDAYADAARIARGDGHA